MMAFKCTSTILLLAASLCMPFAEINAFQPATVIHSRGVTRLHVTRLDESAPLVSSRRLLFRKLLQGTVALPATAALILGNPGISHAAVASPAELKKLQLGHARVQYLLKNWDVLTETCNNKAMSSTEQKQVVRTEGGGGGFCDKTPLVVQEYLGYKSTEDPLFKADKLMLKAVPLVDESVLDAADYVDLVERYREKADQTSLMAYTSSWGEANPNGGKEVVDDYLERTKDEVKETERLLRLIMGALKLEVLPPSDKKA